MADRPALTQVASTQAASAFEARKSTTAVVMAAGLTLALVGLELSSTPLMLAAVISGGTTAYVAGRRVLPASTLVVGACPRSSLCVEC
jgi:hypothetical protein